MKNKIICLILVFSLCFPLLVSCNGVIDRFLNQNEPISRLKSSMTEKIRKTTKKITQEIAQKTVNRLQKILQNPI